MASAFPFVAARRGAAGRLLHGALAIITDRTSFYRCRPVCPRPPRIVARPGARCRSFVVPFFSFDVPIRSAMFIAGYPLKAHNTFGFDVRAQLCVQDRTTKRRSRRCACAIARAVGLPRLVLGGGSNVVLTRDFDGCRVAGRIAWPPRVREDDDAFFVEAARARTGMTLWHGPCRKACPGSKTSR